MGSAMASIFVFGFLIYCKMSLHSAGVAANPVEPHAVIRAGRNIARNNAVLLPQSDGLYSRFFRSEKLMDNKRMGPVARPVKPQLTDMDFLLDDVDSDQLEMPKRYDDYGHMRFGKRGEEGDDYGHMRFGKRGDK